MIQNTVMNVVKSTTEIIKQFSDKNSYKYSKEGNIYSSGYITNTSPG